MIPSATPHPNPLPLRGEGAAAKPSLTQALRPSGGEGALRADEGWRSLLHTLILSLFLLLAAPLAHADTADTQAQIDDRSQKIAQLQKDIAALQIQLNSTSEQKQTLQSTLKALYLSNKKLSIQITLTQNQIDRTNFEIQTLSTNIATTSSSISREQGGISASLRDLDKSDAFPIGLRIISGATLSDAFTEMNILAEERDALQGRIQQLSKLKTTLVATKTTAQQKRDELAAFKSDLSGQKQALAATISDKNDLLKQTKNQESSYQKIIAQKKVQEASFEQELADFQNQLSGKVDISTLPHAGSGVLLWPLSTIRVTQYFGNTAFSAQHSQVYNGHGHSGVDFAASVGTPILAADPGVVLGTGNTDLTCPNASYGKWVLVRHNNGLTTLYGHLSVISSVAGQSVAAHQVLGYSGMTGYATGPHLHFAVFASDVVQISSFASKGCHGRIYTMPVAPLVGYLNPMVYL